jgi:aryl-alcohol dehydrogenase-like predicted oxidoreductase
MNYRQLGRTGLLVSEISLGTMTFGNPLDEAASIKMMDLAIDSGINFIDTADMYVDGLTEVIVGKGLKGKRDRVILATKVGAWKSGPEVNDVGLSRKHIMDGIELSLQKLQTDYIDLYYAHKPDPIVPIDETLRAMDDLVHQGKVRYIACSNYPLWKLCKALCVSELHNLARFDCIQPPYNLITRGIEEEVLPLCESEGIGVCVYNPLAGGILTGKHDPNKPPMEGTRFASKEGLGKSYRPRYWLDTNFNAAMRIQEIAKTADRSMPQFAIAWILNNPTITSVICGATSMQQLEENLSATELKISDEELRICNEAWHELSPPRFSYGSQQVDR